jgi:hypothetical protein
MGDESSNAGVHTGVRDDDAAVGVAENDRP